MDMNQMRAIQRLSDVKRWNMVRTSRDQSVLEHSAMVGVIAARIASKLRQVDPYSAWEPSQAMYWGMLHDADEAITGDIPSHVKRAVKDGGLDIDELSDFEKINPMYRVLIKAADRIEGFMWLQEYRHGSHANWVLTDIEKSMFAFFEAQTPPIREACMEVLAELRADVRPNFALRFEPFEQ